MTTSLKQRAYSHIRQLLLSGNLAPGSRVTERSLADQIGISRTPVREALRELRSEGFLDHVNGVGTYAKAPSRAETIELFEVRMWLECGALEKVVRRIDAATIGDLETTITLMREAIDQASSSGELTESDEIQYRWRALDSTFHVGLLRAANNGKAMKVVADLQVMVQTLGRRRGNLPLDRFRIVVDEHQQILDAVRAGDAAGARRVMEQHINKGMIFALEAVDAWRRVRLTSEMQMPDFPDSLRDVLHGIETGETTDMSDALRRFEE